MNKQQLKILSICILTVLLSSCNYRTESRERFSKALDIEIPNNVEVLKDEYQDMLQDFVILYNLKLTEGQMRTLIKSIKKSKFYYSDAFVKGKITTDVFVKDFDVKAVWLKSDVGYVFQKDEERCVYSAKVDTINLTAKFIEGHD